MAVIPYDYIDQDIQATALVQIRDNDSFYNPSLGHNGFAADGTRYTNGVQDAGPVFASWFTEGVGTYRGTSAPFPNAGLILLSKVSLVILDETTRSLNLWMQFLLEDQNALTDNFNGGTVGFTPKGLLYANGIVSVTYKPDGGATDVTSQMVVTLDFTQDNVYLDVAVPS
jgi:hypothetical protein